MLQLVVDLDADCLKGLFRRMPFASFGCCRISLFNQLHQLEGGFDRLFFPCPHNFGGDAHGKFFFSVLAQNTDQLLLRVGIDHIIGAQTVLAHAHIQLGIKVIGKAALGGVQLAGRNAQIQQDTIHLWDAQSLQNLRNVLKIPIDHLCCRKPLGRCLDGVRVLINGNQSAALLKAQPLCNLGGMSRTSCGPVHIDSVWTDIQSLDCFLQQHRHMLKLHSFALLLSCFTLSFKNQAHPLFVQSCRK